MRRLWIRIVFWWNGECTKHTRHECGMAHDWAACKDEHREKRAEYLDALLKELNP
jgi:hypothetical protein